MPKNFLVSKIGIIGGGGLFGLEIFRKTRPKSIATPYGRTLYYRVGNFFLINRHGPRGDTLPHKINYRANIFAFKKMGTKYIFSFNSVGALKKEIKPGQFLIPHDYIDFDPITFFDKKFEFITPEISQKLRKVLIKILRDLKINFKNQGVYYQTRGPRLETKAEIKMIKNFADVVGMTMAKEATLAKEIGLEYASLCSVDNYAHGISKNPLTQEEIKEKQKESSKVLNKIIKKLFKIKLK